MEDIARNSRIGSDRVTVEKIGRVSRLFRFFSNKYCSTRDPFNLVTDFCFSLTNFHLQIHLLREQDFEYYQQACKRLQLMSTK